MAILQAGDVVLVPGLLGQLQHPDEHGRHELRVGDAVIAAMAWKRLLGVEPLRHDDGGAEDLQGTGPAQRGRVVDRPGRQVHRVLVGAEEHAGQPGQGLARLGHLAVRQRRPDALGPAGGARGVQHGGAGRLVGERLGGSGGDRVLVAAVPVDRAAVGQPERGRRDLAGDRGRGRGLLGRDDQRLRAAVGDDVGHLVRLEVPVDGGDVQAGADGGPVHLEGAQVVLGQQRHHVAGPQARVVQHVRQLDRAPLEVPVGERLAGAGHDRRDLVRRRGRVRAWVHGPPPGTACPMG